MEDKGKTKKQLIEELNKLRKCLAKLQGFEEEINQTKADLEKFTKVFRQNTIPMAISTAKEGRFVDANNSFLRMVGLKREKVIGHTSRETGLITEEQRSLFYNELSKEGHVENLEFEVQPKGRGTRYGLFSFVMMNFSSENYLLTTIQDITDRRKAQGALKESHKRYKSIVENAGELVFRTDINGYFTFVNSAACDYTGYKEDEIIGKHHKMFVNPETYKKILALISDQFEKKIKNTYYVYPIITKDGRELWVGQNMQLIDEDGQFKGYQVVARDITDLKHAHESLVESEKKYRMIAESIEACVFLMDKNNLIKHVIHSRELLGYETEEIIGTSGFSILHPDDLERMTRLYNEGITNVWNEKKYQNRLRHKDGHYVLVENNVRTYNDLQGNFMAGVFVCHEMTSHKKMAIEQQLNPKVYFRERRLSPREREILTWVMEGKSTWDISTILKITESTVKFHIDNLMKKLSAVNRTQAVAIALREELIS